MRQERELSPLEIIEGRVQSSAKHASIDMGERNGIERILELIREEIATWQLDFRRGTRPFDLLDPDDLAERALRNLTGYGPLGPLLDDPDVWEVMVNSPSSIFVKRHRGHTGYHHESF